MTSSDFDIPVLVSYRRSQRAKYLRITVHPTQTVTVTIPINVTKQQAQQYLKSKISWVNKQIVKINQYNKLQETPDLNIDLNKAQDNLLEKLAYFSDKYNLPYNKATFRCQKTKWGSCSGQNNISLNINIVYLPKELQNYLLLHELVHTKVRNHSQDFWEELDKYTDGKAKELSRRLKNYKMKIMA